MKGFNKMLSSAILLMVVSNAVPVYAAQPHNPATKLPVYENVISDISLGYDDALLAGTIIVNDGEIMRVLDYKKRDDNIMRTWHAGDIVSFESHVTDDGLVLSAHRLNTQNPSEVEPYVIFDVVESSPKKGLKIVEINEHGKYVKLSDESVWKFGWFSGLSTKTWEVGQRVLVEGRGEENCYGFINLDAPVSKNVASANGTFVAH